MKLPSTPSTCIPYAVHLTEKQVINFLLPESHMTAAKFLGTKIIFVNLQGTLLCSWWLTHKRKLTVITTMVPWAMPVSMASFLCLVHESVDNASVRKQIHGRNTGNPLFIYHHHQWTMVMLCSILLPQLSITIKTISF